MRLSVCMITYNHEAFIKQAITSALEQDVDFEYEIVVGEDCSTDSTESILKTLERYNQDRVKVIYRRPNIGSRANFYSTLAACTGDYVAFLEGDDYWTSENKLQRQVDFLETHPNASCVFHRTRAVGAAEFFNEYLIPSTDPPEFSSFDFLVQNSNPVALSSLVARRACLSHVNTWLANIKPGDWPLCMMLASQGDLGFIPLEMSHYRVHAGGKWSGQSPHLQFAYVMQMLDHVSRLLSGDAKKLVERRKVELADWWCGNVIHDPRVQLDAVVNDLNHVGACELSTYLLSVTADKARNIEQSRLQTDQAWRAGEAAAAQAKADLAQQSAKVAELSAKEAELTAKAAELSAQVAKLSAKEAELKKQTARTEAVIGARIRKLVANFRRKLA